MDSSGIKKTPTFSRSSISSSTHETLHSEFVEPKNAPSNGEKPTNPPHRLNEYQDN